MQYQNKRAKITGYIRGVIDSLKNNQRTGNKKAVVAYASIELGVKECEIEEVLQTFQNAGIVEIKNDEIIV